MQPTPPKKEVIESKSPTPKIVASTFTAIPMGESGAPLGFWEFLPSAYHANTDQRFAVVIFFHGVGEGGDGNVASLQKLLKMGPPAILSNAEHPLHDLFEQNNVIVLAPQCRPSPEWWHAADMGPFMDHVLARYRNRVDRRRIYLTGLSAGALGIHELMDKVPEKAHQAAAILVTATVGGAGSVGEPFAGPGVGAVVPYWALTSEGDSPAATIAGMNKMAGFILGKAPTDLLKTYPGRDKTHTATFDPKTGWTWQPGIPTSTEATLRLTLYSGSDHASSVRTYDNADCWKWLFSQQLPAGTDPLEKF
jgi:predicted peptidase